MSPSPWGSGERLEHCTNSSPTTLPSPESWRQQGIGTTSMDGMSVNCRSNLPVSPVDEDGPVNVKTTRDDFYECHLVFWVTCDVRDPSVTVLGVPTGTLRPHFSVLSGPLRLFFPTRRFPVYVVLAPRGPAPPTSHRDLLGVLVT